MSFKTWIFLTDILTVIDLPNDSDVVSEKSKEHTHVELFSFLQKTTIFELFNYSFFQFLFFKKIWGMITVFE